MKILADLHQSRLADSRTFSGPPPPSTSDVDHEVARRARLSQGTSCDPIYQMVADALVARHPGGGTLIDVGCGVGHLRPFLRGYFDRYIGVDVVRYESLPADVEFYQIDLDTGRSTLPEAAGDVVVAVETIEHLENPRGLARELTRLTKPGGWLVITTPNQLSLLSKLTLVVKNEFNAFQAGNYPAHLTALLETDLRRIASECSWSDTAIAYSRVGRTPGTARSWPQWLSRAYPRMFSDNVLLVGRKSAVPRDSDG